MNTKHLNGLVVYGDIGIDIHIRTSYQPSPGQDAIVEKIIFEPGGSAANCAAAAAYLGIPTTFIGFIGNDYFGKVARSDMERYGVSTRYLTRISGDTALTIAVIDPNGERTFYSYRGVNASGELLEAEFDYFKSKKFFHISGYSFQDKISRNNVIKLARQAKKMGVLISFDPSYWYSKEYQKRNPDLLSEISIIFPSKEEAKLLSGSSDPVIASQILLELGSKIVIITLGEEGCYVSSKEESFYLPTISNPNVIDTTGAGDAFCGGFLAGLIIGLNVKEAAKVGNITASRIISCIGGHKGAPTIHELLEDLIRNHEDELAKKISLCLLRASDTK